MKTKLITVFLFLITFQLNAQFHFKVTMDETGLYTVKLKSDITINPGSITGSGQISLKAPLGGFKIGAITSVNGTWNSTYDIVRDSTLPDEYYFIGLRNGEGLADKGIAIGEEITLITFQNIGVCTGSLEIINDNDNLLVVLDSIHNALLAIGIITCGNNPRNDISVFDSTAGKIYKFSGPYDNGQAICNPYYPPYSPIEEEIKLEVDNKGVHKFYFKWTPIANATFYELKIRQKGKRNWEKKLITTTPTAYIYSLKEEEFEYQITAHNTNKLTQSNIAKFSNLAIK